MRTTLEIDEDVLRSAREIAQYQKKSLGAVITELARKGLAPVLDPPELFHGFPSLPRRPAKGPVTPEHIKDLELTEE
jgi:hypothetical protein